jgi:hypothetical protein
MSDSKPNPIPANYRRITPCLTANPAERSLLRRRIAWT